MVQINATGQPEASDHLLDVTIDGVEVDYAAIARVDIHLRENEHDYARLILAGISPLSLTEYDGRAVQINVSVRYSEGFTFCGYINFIEPAHKVSSGTANDNLFQEAHIHCLGASAAMRGKRNRVWSNFSVLDMVERMAVDYTFSYSCPDNTPVIARKIQQGKSDWQTLAQTCVASGLAVNLHGTEIHVWNPYNYIRYGAPYAEIGTPRDGSGIHSSAHGRVLEFDGSLGAAQSRYGSAAMESLPFVDSSGRVLQAQSSELVGRSGYGTSVEVPFDLEDVVPVGASSYSDALRHLAATRAYSDAYAAKVSTTGVAGPVPGSAVGVAGFMSEVDGAWLVREINMKFNRGHFVTEFGLTRNTKGTSYAGLGILNAYESGPPSVLRGTIAGTKSVWRTTIMRGHVYSSN